MELLSLCLAVGCGGDGAAPPSAAAAAAVTDSAGTELVRNELQGPTLEAVADLRIGVAEGPEALQFHQVSAVTLAPTGSVLVSDIGSGEVREFDAAGNFVRTLGRKGDGPGEFQRPGRSFVLGDTVAVFDAGADRLTYFAPDGQVLRTEPTRAGAVRLYVLGHGPGGWIAEAYRFGEWRYREWQASRDTARVYVIPDLAAWQQRQLADSAADAARAVVEMPRGRMFGIPSPLVMTANAPLWEPEPWIAADGRGRIYVSPGGAYRIDVIQDGRLVRRITRKHEPVPVTDELHGRYFREIGRYLDTTRARHAEWPIEEAALRGRERLPRNVSLPALRRLFVSMEGALWAERPDLRDDPVTLEWSRGVPPQATDWDVFDEAGRLRGTVRLPAGFTPRTVTADAAWGVQRDELDVETVVRYSLKGQ